MCFSEDNAKRKPIQVFIVTNRIAKRELKGQAVRGWGVAGYISGQSGLIITTQPGRDATTLSQGYKEFLIDFLYYEGQILKIFGLLFSSFCIYAVGPLSEKKIWWWRNGQILVQFFWPNPDQPEWKAPLLVTKWPKWLFCNPRNPCIGDQKIRESNLQ